MLALVVTAVLTGPGLFFKTYRGPVGADKFEQIRTKTGVRLNGLLFRGYRELATVKRARSRPWTT